MTTATPYTEALWSDLVNQYGEDRASQRWQRMEDTAELIQNRLRQASRRGQTVQPSQIGSTFYTTAELRLVADWWGLPDSEDRVETCQNLARSLQAQKWLEM